ncbi:MAG: histidine--tRNA ligase [Rickettsiales bacterium]|jgi:histidyl-tRNA synthetase|nr:histidine--tRNA ligase [Rickettsiales bacterium]
MEKLQPVRGTKDLFGEDYAKHEYIIDSAKRTASLYGYQGISTPIFEFSNVFKRSLGESSDVVGKEMYSFLDKGGEEITLRPEFTASVCRAYISNGFKQLLPLKLFTHGPLFRYERPQKGRQRQFHQLNYEFLGAASPEVDAEMIAMAASLLDKIDVLKHTSLELNSLGCAQTRKNYQNVLVEYLKEFENDLSHDSKIRLYKNPLRILDSKDEGDKKLIAKAPKINDHFTAEAEDFFAKLQEYLVLLGIEFRVNSKLVRGLDYYNHTAFEFTTTELGAQGTVLGGGRYNGLIKLLGGDETEGIGFAAGIERLALLCDLPEEVSRPCAVILQDKMAQKQALKIVNDLRNNDIAVQFDGSIKFDKALKNAVKNNCQFAIFIGEEELKSSSVKLKNLDTRIEQVVKIGDLKSLL